MGNVTLHSVEHVTFYKLYNRSVAKVTLDDVMLKVKEIIDTMCVAKMTAILFNCCMFELFVNLCVGLSPSEQHENNSVQKMSTFYHHRILVNKLIKRAFCGHRACFQHSENRTIAVTIS